MSSITNFTDFKKEIRRCRELKIPRQMLNFSYTHHVFVGEVADDWCDLYHSTVAFLPVFKLNSPGKITKVRLDYTKYKTCKVFNFDNGDVVIIVDRDDYPHDEESEEVCIERANLRLGEERYSASENNCESYVNWIFSNDNTSKQIKSSKSKQIAGDAVDGLVSTGIVHPAAHSASGVIHYSESSKEENARINSENIKKKTLSEKLDETPKKLTAKKSEGKKRHKPKEIRSKEIEIEKTEKESMESVKSPEHKTLNKKRGDKQSSAFQENTKKTNAKSMSQKMENTRPRSFNDIYQAAEKMKEDMRPHKALEVIEKAEHLSEQKGKLMRNMNEDRINKEQIQINEHVDNWLPQKSEIDLTNTQHSYSRSDGLELNNVGAVRSLATSTDSLFIPKQVAKEAQSEGIKNISNAAVYFSVGVETVSLSYSLYKIHTNKSTTEGQKIKGTVKEVCSSVCGISGSVIGQAVIPIPVVGCLIGGAIGNMYGSVVGGQFGESVAWLFGKR